MKYAIELYFDQSTEQELMNLAQLVADQKLSMKYLEWKTRSHLTLACFDDVDERKCVVRLTEFAQSHTQLPAYIGSVGMFTDTRTIFASPIMNDRMFQFQRALCEQMEEFDSTQYGWYHPNRWVPHCALALMNEDNEEAFYQASDLILRRFKKLSGKFTSIGLVKVSFPVEELFTAGLNQ